MLYSGKKTVFFLVIIMFAITSVAFAVRYYFPKEEALPALRADEAKKEIKERILTGAISDIYFSAKVIIIEDSEKEFYLAALPETKIFGKDNKETEFNYLRRGFVVFGKAEEVSDFSYILKELRILREPNIIVHAPKQNAEVFSPIFLRGEARVFENSLNYELTDEYGRILTKNFLTAESPDIEQYGLYEAEIFFAQPSNTKTILSVFNYSARDGSKENVARIPLIFNQNE